MSMIRTVGEQPLDAEQEVVDVRRRRATLRRRSVVDVGRDRVNEIDRSELRCSAESGKRKAEPCRGRAHGARR